MRTNCNARPFLGFWTGRREGLAIEGIIGAIDNIGKWTVNQVIVLYQY